MRVYLAGPEVFLPNAREVIAAKSRLAERYGFSPGAAQGDLVKHGPMPPHELGVAIARHNEQLMRDADLIIANLSPFRGVSADVGTVYELGFMCALGRPAFGYTNDPRDYDRRVEEDYCPGPVVLGPGGRYVSADGLFLERHGMADNLMLDGGIAMRGGTLVRAAGTAPLPLDDLSVYESCLAAARQALLSAS